MNNDDDGDDDNGDSNDDDDNAAAVAVGCEAHARVVVRQVGDHGRAVRQPLRARSERGPKAAAQKRKKALPLPLPLPLLLLPPK